jgi:hypothetical protein
VSVVSSRHFWRLWLGRFGGFVLVGSFHDFSRQA